MARSWRKNGQISVIVGSVILIAFCGLLVSVAVFVLGAESRVAAANQRVLTQMVRVNERRVCRETAAEFAEIRAEMRLNHNIPAKFKLTKQMRALVSRFQAQQGCNPEWIAAIMQEQERALNGW
jgi:Na+-transporting NADH:ubiquinone oxidoreductase subunit NqrC